MESFARRMERRYYHPHPQEGRSQELYQLPHTRYPPMRYEPYIIVGRGNRRLSLWIQTKEQVFSRPDIHNLRQLLEKYWEFNKDVQQLFMDFRQAYDTIIRDSVWIANKGIQEIFTLTKLCISITRCRVKVRIFSHQWIETRRRTVAPTL